MYSTHPHIEDLRRYLSNVPATPDTEIASIERHLDSCAFCRDIIQELKDFLEIRETVDKRRVEAETQKLLEKIRTGRSPAGKPIVMFPKEKRRVPDAPNGKRMVLAAATPKTAREDYSAVATLYSGDERTLLRILVDHTRHEYALYLLFEKQENASHVLVESPLSDIPVMTDDRGMCRIPVRRELLIETDTFRLHAPLVSFALSTEQRATLSGHETAYMPLESHTVELREENAHLLFQVGPGDETTPPVSHIGAVAHDRRVVAPCLEGMARLPRSLIDESPRFILY